MTENQKETLEVKRLGLKTLIKIFSIGLSLPMSAFIILGGLSSFAGRNTVQLNQEYVHGYTGLITSIILGSIMWCIFSLLGAAGAWVSLWLYSRLKPLQIDFYTNKN